MTTITQAYELQNRATYSQLAFSGDLDAATVEQIKPALQAQLPPDCAQIIIDLENVSFIDSHGVGLFVSLLKRVHRLGGRLLIAGAAGQPAAVLKMVGLNGALVSYCTDRHAALQILAS